MRLQNESHEKKTIELKKLETQFLQQKDESEKKKIEKSIKKKKSDIAKLSQTLASWEQITALTLQITTLMIKAGMLMRRGQKGGEKRDGKSKSERELLIYLFYLATAEDLGEVLRDQTIIAFKVDNTPERWDQVRALCNEEEWEETKNELVQYVMKRDENIAQKIELLLKDGYVFFYSSSLFSAVPNSHFVDFTSNVYLFSRVPQFPKIPRT